jgi:hypothetical protein
MRFDLPVSMGQLAQTCPPYPVCILQDEGQWRTDVFEKLQTSDWQIVALALVFYAAEANECRCETRHIEESSVAHLDGDSLKRQQPIQRHVPAWREARSIRCAASDAWPGRGGRC